MYLQRLQVEEGFLDGLDVSFKPGLNVIIGARGTGKTSLIELIRYALDAPAFSDESLRRGTAQAISVLQGGRVVLTAQTPAGPEVIERDAQGPPRHAAGLRVACTVLAQNEIEAVGAQATGRLHLIDRFRDDRELFDDALETTRLTLRSQATQILSLLKEAMELAQQAQSLGQATTELDAAISEQSTILESVQATEVDRARLDQLQQAGRRLGAQRNTLDQTAAQLAGFRSVLREVLSDSRLAIEEWPPEAGPEDLLVRTRSQVESARQFLLKADQQLQSAQSDVAERASRSHEDESALIGATREIRQRLEALQSGTSAITRRVQHLQERVGQLEALRARIDDRRTQFQHLQSVRDETYAVFEGVKQEMFDQRLAIANGLTNSLGPTIRVTVCKSAELDAYAAAIAASLRGSGLHYSTSAPLLARRLSPLELVRAAENFDSIELSKLADIPADRAQAVLAALRSGGTSEIIAAHVDDVVTLELLDGLEYKSTDSLSIGQRCTVVLPLLLNKRGDPLLVDQPEDHLDNAFIANTLVRSLAGRSEGDQFIFASHNANIPVLAEADRVIVMDSDGHRGFVVHAGPLDDPETVFHIANILEGGAEAFARRANFYATPSPE